MKKTMLKKNFYQYQFEPIGNHVLGQNIFVLYHEQECIVFDAGYQSHMQEVQKEVEGYTIKHVILTHFHPDHCYGLLVLPQQHTIGSASFKNTLNIFEEQDNPLIHPEMQVKDEHIIKFHNHNILSSSWKTEMTPENLGEWIF